jgi:dTDP-4-dehydrorhamnose reductase
MKITVLGATGMAGHMIVQYLRDMGHNVVPVTRQQIDVENINSVNKYFANHDCGDFLINCIGLLVADSCNRPDRAVMINSWFPRYIEYVLKESYTRIIHLSTDCVFNGDRGFYTEQDTAHHSGTDSYSRSKLHGELNNSKDITFRMSIIGPELHESGTGLFNWVVNNSSNTIQGWSNAWWNGMTTLQLAKCIEKYIDNPVETGIYHLTCPSVSINKYELLKKINEIFQLEKTIEENSGTKYINKILLDTRKTLNIFIPDYNTQLSDLREYINHKQDIDI